MIFFSLPALPTTITAAVSLSTKSHRGSLHFHFSKNKDEIKQSWIWPANNPPRRPQETQLHSLQLLSFQWERGQAADSTLLCIMRIICINVSLLENPYVGLATTTGKSSLSLFSFDSIFTTPPTFKRYNYLIMAEGQSIPIWGKTSSSYSYSFCLLSHPKLASVFALPNVILVAWDC